MSFEDSLIRNIDRKRRDERREKPRELPDVLEKAHERARKLMSNQDYAIQASEFIDLYGFDNVKADMMRVKKKQQEIAVSDTPESANQARVAEVFEAIALEQTELSNWLGQDVSVLKTSRYDDYFNGTDLIAEWQDVTRESRVLGLAVDVTFGARSVEKKLGNIRRQIDHGALGKIKYFRNSDGTFRGERSMVPHAVIGVGRESVVELSRLWMNNDKKALGAHPIQRVIAEELYEQLRAMQGYAAARGMNAVAEAYSRALDIVVDLRAEKKPIQMGILESDRVYHEIVGQSRLLFR